VVKRNQWDKGSHYSKLNQYFKNDAQKKDGYYRKDDREFILNTIRKRLMWNKYRTALDHIISETDKKELYGIDIGCGMGHFILEMIQKDNFRKIIGMDVISETFTLALQRRDLFNDVEFIKGSLLDIPLQKDTMDITFCLNLLHHIHPDDLLQSLTELARISKGYIVIEIRNKDHLFSMLYNSNILSGSYKTLPINCTSRKDIQKIMIKNGYNEIFIKGNKRSLALSRRLLFIYKKNEE